MLHTYEELNECADKNNLMYGENLGYACAFFEGGMILILKQIARNQYHGWGLTNEELGKDYCAAFEELNSACDQIEEITKLSAEWKEKFSEFDSALNHYNDISMRKGFIHGFLAGYQFLKESL